MARHFKFTRKKRSKKGLIALIGALFSGASFFYVVTNSFRHRGEGSVYLGSLGVFALFVSFAMLLISYQSTKEEDTYKLEPYLSLVLSIVTFFAWMALYMMGLMQ